MQTRACLSCKVVHHHWPTQRLDIKIAMVSMASPSSYSFSKGEFWNTPSYIALNRTSMPCHAYRHYTGSLRVASVFWTNSMVCMVSTLEESHYYMCTYVQCLPQILQTVQQLHRPLMSSGQGDWMEGKILKHELKMSRWCREVYHNRNVQLSSGSFWLFCRLALVNAL